MSPEEDRFQRLQDAFFEQADEQHFSWQTTNRVISRTERELLQGFPVPVEGRLLEVGCGEGGNILNLQLDEVQRPAMTVGVDYSRQKIEFAQRHVRDASFVCADVTKLPFDDAYFDAVLCRDVLHHLTDQHAALREIRRVCKGSGSVWILEPNSANPFMRLLAVLRPHERGLLANSPSRLSDLAAAYFSRVRVELRQPMPIYRLVLHHQVGVAHLGDFRIVDGLARLWDAMSAALVPRRWWAYILVRASP